MEKFIIYNSNGYPQEIEDSTANNISLESKIDFAKHLLLTEGVMQVEFEHQDSRYTVELEIHNT